MSDFVSDFDPGPDGPWLGSAVMCDRQSFVNDCEQMQMWDCMYFIGPGHREASPESGDRLAVPDVVGALLREGGQITDHSDSDDCHSVRCVRYNRTREVIMCLRSLIGQFSLGF